jgi:serine phosphatase RsbU (regulator of sigma subunit)
MEELGLLRGTIRVLTFDRYGDMTYDTGSFNRETLTRFGDLTGNEIYSRERNSYFAQAEKKLAVDKRADYDYKINNHSFHVRYIPVYRNPTTFKRIELVLSEMQSRGSAWKSFLKEDAKIAASFAQLSSQMRTRLAELRKAGTPPTKDPQYAGMYAKYRDLLAERETTFAQTNPYRFEPERIAEDYSRRKNALKEEILVSEKKIDALAKSPKKKEEITAETERIRSEISETRAQIAALSEGEKLDRDDIGRSTQLSAADAFRTLREAALLDFSILRQKNDASNHRSYLRSPEARAVEQKRWSSFRSWIYAAKSETDIPELIPGTRLPLLDGGVLAYSRTEAEEYMWKIDAMPIADVIGFFGVEADISGLLGSLLSRNEMGYNAVLIDKTDGLAQIDAGRRTTLIVTALIAILAVFATYFIAGFMARRITMISKKARQARGGNLEITFPESGMDEIADMGISLNAMIEGLKEREELKGELSAAGEIQKQILPETIPTTLEGDYSIGRLYTSMMGVGGDYYDFIEIEKDKLLFCIGDVSNHGVGPAMVMAMVRAHLHGIVKSGERDLAKILLELNQRIYRETPPQIFVTFFIGILNGENNTITYCSAGHLKPIVYRHKEDAVERIAAGGLPLGMDDNDFFKDTITVRSIQMKPGDFFFQFTDGLSEAKSSTRELFTEERLEAEVAKAARKKMDIAVKMIGTAVGDYAGKDLFTPSGMTDLDDDCALIAFKRLK